MSGAVRAALGLKARTGRAILVALAGDVHAPALVERSQFKLLPVGAFAPYHAAADLEPVAGRASVAQSVADAHRLAQACIREAGERVEASGYELCGGAVLTGTGMPDWTTDDILAVHVRMHKAEGELFRDVLAHGVRECGIPLTTLPEKSALDDAAKRIGISRERLDAILAALGKATGPPWAKDQKEAAAAALVALCAAQA